MIVIVMIQAVPLFFFQKYPDWIGLVMKTKILFYYIKYQILCCQLLNFVCDKLSLLGVKIVKNIFLGSFLGISMSHPLDGGGKVSDRLDI